MANTNSNASMRLRNSIDVIRDGLTAKAPRFVFAFNFALVAVVSLLFSFLLDIQHSYWCLLTVALVAQGSSGLTVWRAVTRTIGTLIGCAVGLAIVACFAQDGQSTIACLALWLCACSYFARYEVGLDAYSYGTAGLTALVIVIETGASADQAFNLAVDRTTETLIPVFACFAIMLVIFPASVSKALLNGFAAARDGVLKLARHAMTPEEELPPGLTQTVARALSGTYANLRAVKLERSHHRVSAAKVEQATNHLNRLMIDAGRLSLALSGKSEDVPEAVADKAAELHRLLEAIPSRASGIEALGEAAASFRTFMSELDRGPEIELLRPEPDAVGRELVALDAMRRLATTMATFLDAEAAISDPGQPTPKLRPMRSRYPDRVAALMRGARPAIVFVALSTLWLASANSSFQTLALISGAMTMMLPTIAPRPGMLVGGKFIGLGMAAMFLPVVALEAALPYVETFTAFALLIGAVLFVFNYICYDPMLKSFGIGGAILIAVTLEPSNAQTYNASQLFNASATLAFLPLVVGSAFMVIFPEDQGWLRRRLRAASSSLLKRAAHAKDDHLNEFVAQSLDAIGDYGGDLDLKEPRNRPDVVRSHALVATGFELYELAQLKRLGHLPPELAATLPDIGAVMLHEAGAARGPSANGDAQAILREARDAGYGIHAQMDCSDLSGQAALRFALGLEFLHLMAEDGRLRVGT